VGALKRETHGDLPFGAATIRTIGRFRAEGTLIKGRDTHLAFGLGLVLLFRGFPGFAQQPNVSDPDNWMLEITRSSRAPIYSRMSAGGKEAQTVFNQLDWQPGWNHTDKSHPQPTGLGFIYRMQGTEVTVGVYLELDFAESRSRPRQEVTVGNFLLHSDQSITVSQLGQFGLQPVIVRLVTAKPPDATPPEIVNETSSLVVENVDQDRAEYKLSLRNTSELAAETVVVSVFDTQGRCKMHALSVWSGPAIPRGATGGFHLSFPIAGEDEGVVGAGGNSCSNAPEGSGESTSGTDSSRAEIPKIVIEAADFEDGSYEGNARKAAMLDAERLGRNIGRSRITALVKEQIMSTQPDGMAKLALVQAQVQALSNKVDPDALNSVLARFPAVPDSSKESVERDVRDGLLMEKGSFLSSLRLYRLEVSQGQASDPSLQRWWDVTKGRGDFLAPPTIPDSK